MITIAADEYRERLLLLCARPGPASFPRRPLDRAIVLHTLSRRFAPGEELGERQTTERIAAWLVGAGSAFDVDPVSLRRALVDDGYLSRGADGRGYQRSDSWRRSVSFEASVGDLEPDLLIDEERIRQHEKKKARLAQAEGP